jgi:hypothetical protein
MPSVSDWPLVPVPPPRGANFSGSKRGSPASFATRTRRLVAREDDGLRRQLVDRVVGGEHRPVGMPLRDVALEAAQPQARPGSRGERRRRGLPV